MFKLKLAPPRGPGPQVLRGIYKENLRNLPLLEHKALGCQILSIIRTPTGNIDLGIVINFCVGLTLDRTAKFYTSPNSKHLQTTK